MKKTFVFLLITILALALVGVAAAHEFGGAPRVTTLSGDEVVPPADEDGSGFAEIILNVGQEIICWEVTFSDIAEPTAAHIHQAPAGANGDVVFPLGPIDHGCGSADPGLIQEIIDHPDQYYVQLHNPEFPAGVIRGQLSNRGQSTQQ